MTPLQIVFSATAVATVAAGGRLEIKSSAGQPCFLENQAGSALQSSCDIIMPSTALSATKTELSALRDEVRDGFCAIRLTHGFDGHNLDMASIVNHDGSGDSATMKSSSDGKCKYLCANDHQAEDSGANQCQPCRTAGAGEFASTVCSTISNTVVTTCDIAGVGEVQTAPCAPGSASTVGSNTAIDTCTTKPSDSSYTTVGSCAWACDAAYKSFDGATCVLTTSPTPYPTAYPTANPTGSPTPVSIPYGRFIVDSGHAYCAVSDTDGCISDGAGSYGNNEACAFRFVGTAVVTSTGRHGAHMETESYYDRITDVETGVYHSGDANWEVAVAGSKAFTWSSDYSVIKTGFKLCPRFGTWDIQSGQAYCHVTPENCIADNDPTSTTTSTRDAQYGNNEACSFTFTGTAKIVSSGRHGAHMETESYFDRITDVETGVYHSGTDNWEVDVAGFKAFTWSSDISVTGGGFKLCPR